MISVSFELHSTENVFSPTLSKSWHRVRKWLWKINLEGSGRKLSWPVFKYYHRSYYGETKETRVIADVRAEKLVCY